jgi:ribose/xylose/arabinose/galactoside ABC-type transport system permease subunit
MLAPALLAAQDLTVRYGATTALANVSLDLRAAPVVGGASLSGGRASVAGAVIGSLIFGVLRNALA